MPHLVIEVSANVIEKNNMQPLLRECHATLAAMLPAKIEACKSRVVECQTFHVGEGQPNNAFVHVTLKIMTGRTVETLQKTGDSLMSIFRNYFAESIKKLNLQVSLEIVELQKTYFQF